ncbi:hypothetical protein AR457_40885 [Streptomyces agglomeratus]|uniref:hypothetical protein n=1 Tax=Streptomyces agglomeratus TaxID=285458 RepID=UPI00086CC16B|nr:hypothetical protein [Streptomyces agglomeratus]OEJ21790.1 hypothetical protein AR457_40885 [Streptomyces agglomeratus]
MSTTPQESTARYRRSRTRSRNVSARPALAVSSLKTYQYDLHPSCPSLICPDCKTWVPITGLNAKKQKLVPHDTGLARKDQAVRCQGSNRLVNIDILVKEWKGRVEVGGPEANGRRSARQHYKPLPAPAKPVARMAPEPMNAADALTAYREHLKKCRASSATGRCGGKHRCTDGTRLAALYEQLLRTQPHRDREQKEEGRVDGLLTRYRQATATKTAAVEWTKRDKVTGDAKKATAKRGGTTIEEANNTCRIHPADTVSELRGPEVPLAPLRISA